MIILGIDSSAVAASAAVLKDSKIISETYINCGLTHSQTLMTLIDSALKNTGISVSDIDFAAVSDGPGSFTGIRIGVAAVKGLCFADNIPCYGVSTLEAMAECTFQENVIICPVMDARCSQVYTALFENKDGKKVRLEKDDAIPLEKLSEILEKYDKPVLLVGDGADITYKYLSEKNRNVVVFSEIFKYQHASAVAFTAYRLYNEGKEAVKCDSLCPVYLRPSQAERELTKHRS